MARFFRSITGKQTRILNLLGAAVCAALVCLPALAEKGEDRSFNLPVILGDHDRSLYRDLFAAQDEAQWRTADRLMKQISDPLLMGHVLAQRYLHPTSWRSSYKDLRPWLAQYGDHPDAQILYQLAVKRRPAKAGYPVRPSYQAAPPRIEQPQAQPKLPAKSISREGRSLERKVIRLLRGGYTKAAKREIRAKRTGQLLGAFRLDRLKARLASGYFGHGRDDWAYDWASKAAARSGSWLPEAHWIAGLAAWRLGRGEDAAQHFAGAATAKAHDPWLKSAAAFWAARSHLTGRNPAEVSHWLAEAARYPETFYGLIARRLLGQGTGFDWTLAVEDRERLA
ncbi:MAG: hypothetical protein ACPGNT_06230, partial [Rhodospirillales bacterium]